MLLFDMFTRLADIKSEKPNSDKELERINNTAKTMMILHEISLLRSEKFVSFE